MNTSKRIILHIDMDYFFAQIEEVKNPFFKNRPVVVGADPKEGKGRGVVSTCNYEARKYGIKSGMPISWAYKRCSKAIFLPVDFGLYQKTSHDIMETLKKYSPLFEQVSVDEAYLDISFVKNYKKAQFLGEKIKKEILEKEKLTSSVGIGPNKLIAKIASGFQKPKGLTIVTPKEVNNFLTAMNIEVLPGIGPKTQEKLNKIGVKNITDLRKLKEEDLRKMFGVWGGGIYKKALGIDENPVEEGQIRKSMGRQITFENDSSDRSLIIREMLNLANQVFTEAQESGFSSKTAEMTIRYSNFQTHTHSKTLPEAISLKNLRGITLKLLWPFLEKKRLVRLIGFRLSNLTKTNKKLYSKMQE